jgi:alanyl-tRNA synthetase
VFSGVRNFKGYKMTSKKLREGFLDFFSQREHIVVKSAPLIVKDDPSLLFNSAGMVQFKPYWTGNVPLPYKRACSVQKCLRLSDLEKVGFTPFHNTFFEMLGNFSFGDYFKKKAIEWGWEFVIDFLALSEEKLYVTVFKDDKEAYEIWRKRIGLKDDRIFPLSEETNFWGPAGKTGACGPSSEIFFDLGEEFGKIEEGCTIENECDRFVEIWNIVFPQFNREEDGSNSTLKNRGIDTGMGLERTLMVCNDKKSIFQTDLFQPIIDEIEKGKNNLSKKIIADHVRALTFTITEGIIPSNVGRGYVVRRLLRRAVLEGKKLGYEEPFLYTLVGKVLDTMSEVYPEIKEKTEHTSLVIKSEEERFLDTIDSGMAIFHEMIDSLKKKKQKTIPGGYVFKLYDTFGFPVELTKELALEREFDIDLAGYEKEMEKQKERAKSKGKFSSERGGFVKGPEKECKFVGDEKLSVETTIIGIQELEDNIAVLLSETPFYAEMGGQVGDTGRISGKGVEIEVLDTQPSPHGAVHICNIKKGNPKKGLKVTAEVDKERRMDIARNHTATHLLQWALRDTLGKHVHQEGSLVAPDRLRFDFTHFSALNKDEIEKVEYRVNKAILGNSPVNIFYEDFERAKELGAIALFDEKYEDTVRVLKIGDFSIELCGGTHVERTGEIGLFKIISESSIASGVRRIEAITGRNTIEHLKKLEERERNISRMLKVNPDKIDKRVEKMLENEKELNRRIEKLEKQNSAYEINSFRPEKIKDGIQVIIEKVSSRSPEILRNLADEASRKWNKKAIGVLGTEFKGNAHLVVFVSRDLNHKIKAGNIIKEVSDIIGGGGGGRDDFATAGGKKKENIDKALQASRKIIRDVFS